MSNKDFKLVEPVVQVGPWTDVVRLENAINPQEAIALRRSGGALTGDEAKALLAVKRVFKDSKIIFRGPHGA